MYAATLYITWQELPTTQGLTRTVTTTIKLPLLRPLDNKLDH